MHRNLLFGPFFVVTSLSSFAVAQPQPEPGMPHVNAYSAAGVFGEHRQLAIMGEAGALVTHTSLSKGGGSTTTVLFRPAIDYFVIDHLSLGAFTGFEHSAAPGGSTTTYSIGPRVGYDIPISDQFSLWPKAGFSLNSTSVKVDAQNIGALTVPATSASNTALALNLFVPLMFHSHHYFAGFGPSADIDLTGSPKATTIALRLTIGGWLF